MHFCLNMLSLQHPSFFTVPAFPAFSQSLAYYMLGAVFLRGENWCVGIVNGFFVFKPSHFSICVLFLANSKWKQES